MPYDLFLFDFDGVLFTTNRSKSEAFREALADYPQDAVDEFITYHEANGGFSRRIKFAHFFRNILGEVDTERLEKRALTRFATAIQARFDEATTLPGVKEFVRQIRSLKKPAAICSGGNSQEIQRLLSTHQLGEFFIRVWGNERTKMQHATENIAPHYKRVLFFGDARYDMETAEHMGWDFVFVSALTDWSDGTRVARTRGHIFIEDFRDARLSELILR